MLDENYLKYPNRKLGYDHDLYEWSALKDRKPIMWKNGAKVQVMICVSLEYFPIIPNDKPFRAPGHMQTPYPDFRHFSAREYGNRIGVYRLLDIFAKEKVKAAFACNSKIATLYPSIINDITNNQHEIIAHSTDMNATIASGLGIQEEKDIIKNSLNELERITGKRPRGFHALSRSQSFNTPDILKKSGVDFMMDWVNDEMPYYFKNGIINLPFNHELSDRQIIVNQQHSAESFKMQILDAFEFLESEGKTQGGRILPIGLTPYIMGLPYRIHALNGLVKELIKLGAGFMKPSEIIDEWKSQNANS